MDSFDCPGVFNQGAPARTRPMIMALHIVALTQLLIAVLNLCLVRIMKWEEEVQKMDRLVREVFHMHGHFLSVSLTIFGVLTLRFAEELAAGSSILGCWLSGSIGVFWLIRWLMQFFYYSPSHWKGKGKETLMHVSLVLVYGFIAGVYLLAAFNDPTSGL